MTSLRRHLANLHKFLYSFEKTIRSYLSMPNFKSISSKMAVLQGGGEGAESASPCVCYPKDPMWNRVKVNRVGTCPLSKMRGNRRFQFEQAAFIGNINRLKFFKVRIL